MRKTLQNDWTIERIEALMERLGMVRAIELAVAVGSHQMTVERWLSGERHPIGIARAALERLEAECREREGAA